MDKKSKIVLVIFIIFVSWWIIGLVLLIIQSTLNQISISSFIILCTLFLSYIPLQYSFIYLVKNDWKKIPCPYCLSKHVKVSVGDSRNNLGFHCKSCDKEIPNKEMIKWADFYKKNKNHKKFHLLIRKYQRNELIKIKYCLNCDQQIQKPHNSDFCSDCEDILDKL